VIEPGGGAEVRGRQRAEFESRLRHQALTAVDQEDEIARGADATIRRVC
jgi:hypothetical protein